VAEFQTEEIRSFHNRMNAIAKAAQERQAIKFPVLMEAAQLP
jgi:hypothetical protein